MSCHSLKIQNKLLQNWNLKKRKMKMMNNLQKTFKHRKKSKITTKKETPKEYMGENLWKDYLHSRMQKWALSSRCSKITTMKCCVPFCLSSATGTLIEVSKQFLICPELSNRNRRKSFLDPDFKKPKLHLQTKQIRHGMINSCLERSDRTEQKWLCTDQPKWTDGT